MTDPRAARGALGYYLEDGGTLANGELSRVLNLLRTRTPPCWTLLGARSRDGIGRLRRARGVRTVEQPTRALQP